MEKRVVPKPEKEGESVVSWNRENMMLELEKMEGGIVRVIETERGWRACVIPQCHWGHFSALEMTALGDG